MIAFQKVRRIDVLQFFSPIFVLRCDINNHHISLYFHRKFYQVFKKLFSEVAFRQFTQLEIIPNASECTHCQKFQGFIPVDNVTDHRYRIYFSSPAFIPKDALYSFLSSKFKQNHIKLHMQSNNHGYIEIKNPEIVILLIRLQQVTIEAKTKITLELNALPDPTCKHDCCHFLPMNIPMILETFRDAVKNSFFRAYHQPTSRFLATAFSGQISDKFEDNPVLTFQITGFDGLSMQELVEFFDCCGDIIDITTYGSSTMDISFIHTPKTAERARNWSKAGKVIISYIPVKIIRVLPYFHSTKPDSKNDTIRLYFKNLEDACPFFFKKWLDEIKLPVAVFKSSDGEPHAFVDVSIKYGNAIFEIFNQKELIFNGQIIQLSLFPNCECEYCPQLETSLLHYRNLVLKKQSTIDLTNCEENPKQVKRTAIDRFFGKLNVKKMTANELETMKNSKFEDILSGKSQVPDRLLEKMAKEKMRERKRNKIMVIEESEFSEDEMVDPEFETDYILVTGAKNLTNIELGEFLHKRVALKGIEGVNKSDHKIITFWNTNEKRKCMRRYRMDKRNKKKWILSDQRIRLKPSTGGLCCDVCKKFLLTRS